MKDKDFLEFIRLRSTGVKNKVSDQMLCEILNSYSIYTSKPLIDIYQDAIRLEVGNVDYLNERLTTLISFYE